jgi:L-ribulose-5-phosphate 4-epimerase
VEYETLTPAAMVLLDMEGKVIEGKLRPCADAQTYLRLYQEFKGIRAIAHTHSHYATIFAQAGLGIPCVGTIHADYFNGDIPATRPMTVGEVHGASYERETGNVILEQFAKVNPMEIPAVLVHSHGPFVWGTSGNQVLERAFVLELVAKLAFKTLEINPETPPISAALREKHFQAKWGPK